MYFSFFIFLAENVIDCVGCGYWHNNFILLLKLLFFKQVNAFQMSFTSHFYKNSKREISELSGLVNRDCSPIVKESYSRSKF